MRKKPTFEAIITVGAISEKMELSYRRDTLEGWIISYGQYDLGSEYRMKVEHRNDLAKCIASAIEEIWNSKLIELYKASSAPFYPMSTHFRTVPYSMGRGTRFLMDDEYCFMMNISRGKREVKKIVAVLEKRSPHTRVNYTAMYVALKCFMQIPRMRELTKIENIASKFGV